MQASATAVKHARSGAGRKRGAVGPRNLWTRRASSLPLGRERFRLSLDRSARRLPPLNIDPDVSDFAWGRSGAKRTGTLTFQVPLTGRRAREIAHGDVVVCEVSPTGSGGWRMLWRLMVTAPSHDIRPGTISVQLVSRLDPLEKSHVAWRFVADKTHPHGWTAREITLAIARRFRVPVGRVASASHRIRRLIEKDATPVEVLTRAWSAERRASGRRFDVSGARGLLEVMELREPQYMLELGPTIMDATIEHSLRRLATAVVVTSRRKPPGARRKLRVKVVAERRLKRYGYIVRHVSHDSDSADDLRRYGKRVLARGMQPRQELTFTHPGIPWVDRGDALRVTIRAADLRSICFVRDVQHAVSASGHTMDVTVGWTDPWKADRRRRDVARKKAQAARRRGRARGEHQDPPQSKRASKRSDT